VVLNSQLMFDDEGEEKMNARKLKMLGVLLVVVSMLVPLVAQWGAPPAAYAEGPCTGSSAQCAVDAAKQYAGATISIVYESGLQAQDGYTIGPMWEEQTGIKVQVVEMAYADIYTNELQDALTGGGAYDVVTFSPMWLQDFVAAGAVELLNPYMDKYLNKADLADYLPVYATDGYGRLGDKWYGFPDDGDTFILYYRTDLFNDEANKAAFKEKYGYDLAAPKTWKQYDDIGNFFTDKMAPDVYGACVQRLEGQAYEWFFGPFSAAGGQYFDPETMKAFINSDIGVATLTDMAAQNKFMPPGVEKWGFMEVLSGWMDGKCAMAITWPPIGRWSAGYGATAKQLSWVPASKVVGKVGYAPMPGGRPTLAGGFSQGVSPYSKNKEAAYLFAQWMTSPEISLKRVMLPFTLRDPYRLSHFDSPDYRALWPEAGAYLDACKEAGITGQYDPGIPGARQYLEAVDNAVTAAYAGTDPKAALDTAAARWDEITNNLGVENQKQAYALWLNGCWNRQGPKVDCPEAQLGQ
jgi:multiple sugar transport system substrate-binding protein